MKKPFSLAALVLLLLPGSPLASPRLGMGIVAERARVSYEMPYLDVVDVLGPFLYLLDDIGTSGEFVYYPMGLRVIADFRGEEKTGGTVEFRVFVPGRVYLERGYFNHSETEMRTSIFWRNIMAFAGARFHNNRLIIHLDDKDIFKDSGGLTAYVGLGLEWRGLSVTYEPSLPGYSSLHHEKIIGYHHRVGIGYSRTF